MSKAFGTALKLMGKSPKPIQAGILPINLVADSMNAHVVEPHRESLSTDVQIHVSELIQPAASRKFCSRNKALQYFYGKKDIVSVVPPGMSMLYKLGNAVHDHVRDTVLKGSAYGSYMYGTWVCSCGRLKRTGCAPNKSLRANVCNYCRTPAVNYEELDLYSPGYALVGHPDLLFKYAKRFYLYELKSWDRKSLPFESLTNPLGDHVLQASFYYWIMNSLGMDVHSNIRFVYVDRSSNNLFSGTNYKEFRVKRSPLTRIQPFLDKAKEVVTSVETRILPNRICDKYTCTRAKHCNSATLCFSKESNEIKKSKYNKI